jgi:hypothetical protein
VIVGLPGAGLSTLFYLFVVAIMPLHALWCVVMGRPLPDGHWRRIARQWAIATGIITVLAGTGLLLSLLVDQPSSSVADGDALRAGEEGLWLSVARLGVLVAAVTLGALLSIVQVLAIVSGVRRRRKASPDQRSVPPVPASNGSAVTMSSERLAGRPGPGSAAPIPAPAGSGRWKGTKR